MTDTCVVYAVMVDFIVNLCSDGFNCEYKKGTSHCCEIVDMVINNSIMIILCMICGWPSMVMIILLSFKELYNCCIC